MTWFEVERRYLGATDLPLLVDEARTAEPGRDGSPGFGTGATQREAEVRRFGAIAQRLHSSQCQTLARRLTRDHLYPTRGVFIHYDVDGYTAKHVDAGACDITVVGQLTECDSPLVLHLPD